MSEEEVNEVVAAVPYCPEKDKFLLVKRSSLRKRFPNEWEFPSGFLEDEKIQKGALRELEEETGLIGQIIRTGENFEVNTEKYQFRIHPVLVKVGFEDIELSEEHEDYEWIEISEIDKFNTVPQLKEDLEALEVL